MSARRHAAAPLFSSQSQLSTPQHAEVCFEATLFFPASRKPFSCLHASNQTTRTYSRTTMNNPALPLYASQNAGPYPFNHAQPNAGYPIPPGTAIEHAHTPFQPGMIPNHMPKPLSHPQQSQQPFPQHLYQQQPGSVGPGSRPQSRSSYSPQNPG